MINRNNYEEFFLLYVDKELNAEEQAAVETFISQNADLARELALLQQATLADSDMHFQQKEILYKNETGISLSNYEEYFLLSADGELNEQQAGEVENFVLKHPQLQDEFTLLQQIKLQPELIEFRDKKKLYRKEKKVKIISFTLLRMGAAAAIAGVIYTSFLVFSDNKSNSGYATAVTTAEPVKKAEKTDSQVQKPSAEKPVVLPDVVKASKSNIKPAKVISKKQTGGVAVISKKIHISEPVSKEAIAVNKPENNEEQQRSAQHNTGVPKENIQPSEPVETTVNEKDYADNTSRDLISPDKNIRTVNEPDAKEEKPSITHAVYLETDNAEEEKSLYIGAAEINKNKLKGLFKKAAVLFDKKIRRNDNDN